MKLFLVSSISFMFTVTSSAQNFHVNLFAGASNYQGDLQDKRFTFSQSHLAGGIGLSYDLSDKFSVRSAIALGKLSANDKYGRNSPRNLNFTSGLNEINLGLEYYITRLADHALTPYVFGGIALISLQSIHNRYFRRKIFFKAIKYRRGRFC